MFDFNCDVAQGYGIYKNDNELEVAKYCSSMAISAGFHAGDPSSIRSALLFARDNNIALGAHIGYPDIQGFGKRPMKMDKDELEALVVYQVGALVSYAQTFDLELEFVRCHGALKDLVNNSKEDALIVSNAIKKVNCWLNLIVQNPEIKRIIEERFMYNLNNFEEVKFIPKLKIRSMKTRWGVCNKRDNSVTINSRLIEYSIAFVGNSVQ